MMDDAANSAHGGSPRVSVVIPTYNRANDVVRCLDSLVAQTFRDFEVLVCDDGSTDNTAQMVERYRDKLDVRYYWAENFGGPARPRNAGVRLARGPYVAFLDSDDWWSPDKLAESVSRLDAGADLVYHDMYVAASAGQRVFWRKRGARALRTPLFDDLIANGNAICNSSVVVRRELLLRIEGFSEEHALIAWEDYDAWLRISRLTERFSLLDKPFGYYWRGGGNISSPRRVIANLERFEELYLTTDPKWRGRAPAWFNYGLGLAHYHLGQHASAIEHMRGSLRGPLPLRSRLKALLIIAACSGRVLVGAEGAQS